MKFSTQRTAGYGNAEGRNPISMNSSATLKPRCRSIQALFFDHVITTNRSSRFSPDKKFISSGFPIFAKKLFTLNALPSTSLSPARLKLAPPPPNTHATNTHNRRTTDAQQCLHDYGMVRSPSQPAPKTMADRSSRQLGYCALRIHHPGPRKSNRTSGHECRTTQDPAGNHLPVRLCPIRMDLPEGKTRLGLSLGCLLPAGRRVLRVPQKTHGTLINNQIAIAKHPQKIP